MHITSGVETRDSMPETYRVMPGRPLEDNQTGTHQRVFLRVQEIPFAAEHPAEGRQLPMKHA